MDKINAKRVLLSFRPETSDRNDPEVAQALALAREDAELRDWLHDQRAFHELLRHELRAVAVPPDLKEKILRERIIVPL